MENKGLGSINEFEAYVPFELNSLDELKIIEGSNMVMVQIFPEDVMKSIGGIDFPETTKSFNFAGRAERRCKVIKTCKSIIPGKSGVDHMMWKCDIDVLPEDELWINYFDSLNSYLYKFKDMTIKLIPYSSIILAKRKDEVIMCNGYLLLEKVFKVEESSEFLIMNIKPEEIKTEGIVRYLGKPNHDYFLPNNKGIMKRRKDKSDYGSRFIKEGDRILLGDVRRIFELEDYAHAMFDNRIIYNVCQRHNVIAILESKETANAK